MNKKTSREEIIKEIEDFLKNDYGSSAKRTGLPKSVEIHCVKDGIDSYFCVMAVSYNEQKGAYFDATVSSEWEFIKEMQKVGKWLKNTYNYDVTIPAGRAFWYRRHTDGDLTVRWRNKD